MRRKPRNARKNHKKPPAAPALTKTPRPPAVFAYHAAMNTAPSRYLPALLALAIFMQMLDATILNTALPKMAQDLRESPLHMHSAIISYALTLALLMPLSGYLCDRYGTRKTFAHALNLFILGSVVCAGAPSLSLLILGRVIQGMGGAMLVPVPRLIVLRAYDKTRFLPLMNYIIMPALLGPVLGPLVGGYLVEYASWHWIFLINVPVGLAALWMTLRIMPDLRAANGETPHFDRTGFLLFGAGAVSLSLAVELTIYPDARPAAALSALAGILALLRYWRHAEKHRDRALYPPQLRLVRTFRLGLLGNLLSRLGMAAVPFLLPLLLQVAFGRSATHAGWTLAPVALAAISSKPFLRGIIGGLGYRRTLIWNTRIIGLLIMSLALPTAATPPWLLIPLLFTLGFCNSVQYAGMNALTIADLRPLQTGSGNSLMAVNQQLAISFGIALGALLLNLFGAGLPEGAPIHRAFRHTFILIGGITFCSSWVFTRLHPRDGDNLLQKRAA